jgi:hypothetical protein
MLLSIHFCFLVFVQAMPENAEPDLCYMSLFELIQFFPSAQGHSPLFRGDLEQDICEIPSLDLTEFVNERCI